MSDNESLRHDILDAAHLLGRAASKTESSLVGILLENIASMLLNIESRLTPEGYR